MTVYTKHSTLLKRTAIQPGESLQSFLARLSLLNDYDTPDTLSQILREGGGKQGILKDRASLPRQAEMYQRLEAMAGLSVSDLYAASAHRFANVLAPPDNSIRSLEISHGSSFPLLAQSLTSKQVRPESAGQFCPLCLKDSVYHRLIWMPIAVSACLEHSCLLVDRCQQCSRKVSTREIIEMRCRKCKSNLAETKALSLKNDPGLPYQQMIQSWLMSYAAPDDGVLFLPQQQPRVLYRVLDGLQWSIRTITWTEWPYLHNMSKYLLISTLQRSNTQRTITPYESYCLYATAFKGLIHWPNGFYEFLQAYQSQVQSKLPNGGPKADLGNLYTQWLQDYWKHRAFEFVQKAFQHYFVDTYSLSSAVTRTNVCVQNPGVAESLPQVNIAEAARLLGTTPKMIDVLIKTGSLTCQDSELPDKRKYRYIHRAEVLALRNKWSDEVNLAEAAKYLGTTEQMVLDLMKVYLLFAEHAPAEGHPYWTFSKSALIECMEKVSKHINNFSSRKDVEQGSLMNLIEASRQLFVVGLNAAAILLCVAEGKLKAYCSEEQRLRLDALRFEHSDIQGYIQSVKAGNGWIGREETVKHLGVKDTTLTRWVKYGLIIPVALYAHVQYFDQKAIVAFIAEHVTSEEAAGILGVGKLTVQKWAHMGRLVEVCVSGPHIDGHHSYIFHRERLIQWREARLTFGEVAKLLQMSNASIQQWVKQKKLLPLNDMGGKQRWFSKKVVQEMRENSC